GQRLPVAFADLGRELSDGRGRRVEPLAGGSRGVLRGGVVPHGDHSRRPTHGLDCIARQLMRHPPIAPMDRRGRWNACPPMPCPACLPHIAPRHTRATSSSPAPERSTPRTSVSSSLNRHDRTVPSAVRRVLSHAAQKILVTVALTPTVAGA